jgi:hypothetical protein
VAYSLLLVFTMHVLMRIQLSPLDRDREASMADEGGVTGAIVENEEGLDAKDWLSTRVGLVAPVATPLGPLFPSVRPDQVA